MRLVTPHDPSKLVEDLFGETTTTVRTKPKLMKPQMQDVGLRLHGVLTDEKGHAHEVSIAVKQLEDKVIEQIKTRYAPGSRVNMEDWMRHPVLRTALSIGVVVYTFYAGSCILRPDQVSEKHMKHRVKDSEFRHRIVNFVRMVYPKFGATFGYKLDGRDGENKSLWKKIYNVWMYAEFEQSEVEEFLQIYTSALHVMFLSTEELRKASITPVDSNGKDMKFMK